MSSPTQSLTVRLNRCRNPTYADAIIEFGRRFIYNISLVTVFASQIWMGFSKDVGDFYGAHILLGLGAAPFEALVAISIADVWFAHERGSKLGTYVFGLAFGSFIGPLCAGYMAVNQGWRWIYWWGAILTGALLVLFFFTFEETRFIRTANAIEGQNNNAESEQPEFPSWEASLDAIDAKKAGKQSTTEDQDLHRQVSLGPKVGDVFDAVGFTVQLSIFKRYPQSWAEILSQMWRPLKVSSLPAVVWVSLASYLAPERYTNTVCSADSTMELVLVGWLC
jgi:MFS family permease